MRTVFILLMIILFAFRAEYRALSQENLKSNHHIFLEVGGTGGYGSVNYEYSFYHDSLMTVSVRLGGSTYTLTDFTTRFNPDIIIPMGMIFRYGRMHQIEAGVGITKGGIVASGDDFTPQRDWRSYGNFSLGYRYHNLGKAWVYRAGYSPLYSFENYHHWAYLSVGYAF